MTALTDEPAVREALIARIAGRMREVHAHHEGLSLAGLWKFIWADTYQTRKFRSSKLTLSSAGTSRAASQRSGR